MPRSEDAFTTPARQPAVTCDPSDSAAGAVGGGWFGYLSYALTDPGIRNGPLPTAVWGWTSQVLRLDRSGQWWFEALLDEHSDGREQDGGEQHSGDRADTAADAVADELDGVLAHPSSPGTVGAPSRVCWPAADSYRTAVHSCVEAIAAGELFQANICTRITASFDGHPAGLFAAGVDTLRPMRAAYLAGDWGAVVSLSPELFLSRRGRRVRSSPIKGTMPRRGAADEHLAEALRTSPKDVAENVLVTDLVRNDLGRVCTAGSVHVPEPLAVRPAPGVWHLDSTVEGTLAGDVGDTELLRATFPPGSVTGAPKASALELITELESEPRGVYTGAVGMASPVAGTELNVAIRTLECHDGTVSLGVGGGITADSDPAAEWQECQHKANPLVELLGGH